MKKILIFLIFYLFFSGVFISSFSHDNLYLRGIVKKVQNNIVVIEVTTSSCKGIRKFKISPKIDINVFKARKIIGFSIESTNCEKNKIHTILEVN